LVSRKIHQVSESWKTTVDRLVLPACDLALDELNRLGLEDARLEIEFPFACREAGMVDQRLRRSSWSEDPVTIESHRLRFQNGIRLKDVPQWEIHFLLEQLPGGHVPRPLQVDQVAAFLQPYGVDVEQTIEYQSQSMIEQGRSDFRLIATAYYTSSQQTTQEAERLFYSTALCQDAADRGYEVRLILEHIVTCVRPKHAAVAPAQIERPTEVNYAS
jgi:hypothetical protein